MTNQRHMCVGKADLKTARLEKYELGGMRPIFSAQCRSCCGRFVIVLRDDLVPHEKFVQKQDPDIMDELLKKTGCDKRIEIRQSLIRQFGNNIFSIDESSPVELETQK